MLINNLRENPLKNLRQTYNLTQRQVADSVGMTTGAVMKYEQGLYEQPSCNLVNFYVNTFDYPAVEITKDYEAWRHWKRINASLPAVENLYLGPLNKHPFTIFREQAGYLSVLSFCVELCLHPGVISKYESGTSKTMPQQVKKALLEAGLSREEILIIQRYGEDYHDQLVRND